jgi:hypothetical protein
VQDGDTLSQIASLAKGTTVKEIMSINNLEPELPLNDLIGKLLLIPKPEEKDQLSRDEYLSFLGQSPSAPEVFIPSVPLGIPPPRQECERSYRCGVGVRVLHCLWNDPLSSHPKPRRGCTPGRRDVFLSLVVNYNDERFERAGWIRWGRCGDFEIWISCGGSCKYGKMFSNALNNGDAVAISEEEYELVVTPMMLSLADDHKQRVVEVIKDGTAYFVVNKRDWLEESCSSLPEPGYSGFPLYLNINNNNNNEGDKQEFPIGTLIGCVDGDRDR